MRSYRVLFLAPLLLLSGCFSFDRDYNAAATRPADPADPLIGAWHGYWQSFDSNATGPVWFVFARPDAGHVAARMKIYDFGEDEPANVYLMDFAPAPIHHPPSGLRTFTLAGAVIGEDTTIYDAAQRGEQMSISYTFGGSQHCNGIMLLRRGGAPVPTSRPATRP